MKKFLKNALVSVFVDKKARDAVERKKAGLPPSPDADTSKSAQADKPKAQPVHARKALEQAEKDLATKPKLTKERKDLIQAALLVRKKQERLLNDLSPDQREKLQAMAMEAFQLDARRKNG